MANLSVGKTEVNELDREAVRVAADSAPSEVKVAITKAHVKKMTEVLDMDHESMEDAAQAALTLAWDIWKAEATYQATKFPLEIAWGLYEAKGKYVVVAQVYYEDGYLSDSDGRASKVCLGPYGTETQAKAAGESLAFSASSGAQLRWWLVPIEHGTPAAWHKRRKEEREAEALANQPDSKQEAIEWSSTRPHWPDSKEEAAA